MNKHFFKFFLTVTFLLLNFVAFAQAPGQGDGYSSFEAEDAATAPINSKLIWLAIVGVAFAYYSFKKMRTAKFSK